MRILLLLLAICFSKSSFAQLREGFDSTEVKNLIAVCNSYTFLELYGSDSLIIPKEYKKVFTSEVIGMDNVFQVYEGVSLGIINFRGSTSEVSSWVENFYSAMIPAKGVIKIDSADVPYCFAGGSNAAVHSGYALTVVLLSSVLIEQIKKLNDKGIFNILITGHSQGGALAQLTHAYLEHIPDNEQISKNVYKTYAFANPKSGNKEFADEYNSRYCDANMDYSIINCDDPVSKLPMNYKKDQNAYGNLFYKSWADLLTKGEVPEFKNTFVTIFESPLTNYINYSNLAIEEVISNTYVSIEMPPYVRDINYFPTGTIYFLDSFTIPEAQSDTIKLNDKSPFFQHKPYNYYVAILKEYFPADYRKLDSLYLTE